MLLSKDEFIKVMIDAIVTIQADSLILLQLAPKASSYPDRDAGIQTTRMCKIDPKSFILLKTVSQIGCIFIHESWISAIPAEMTGCVDTYALWMTS